MKRVNGFTKVVKESHSEAGKFQTQLPKKQRTQIKNTLCKFEF